MIHGKLGRPRLGEREIWATSLTDSQMRSSIFIWRCYIYKDLSLLFSPKMRKAEWPFTHLRTGLHLRMAPKQVLPTWGSFVDKVAMKQRPQSQCSEEMCVYLKYKDRVLSSHHIREEIATLYFHPHKSCHVVGHSLNPFILNVIAVFWVSYIAWNYLNQC